MIHKPEVFFEVTDACNFKCDFCCKTWHTKNKHLSLSELKAILHIQKSCGKVSGGEPGLCKNEVFYYLEHETSYRSLNTNLSLWNPEEIIKLNYLLNDLTVNIPSLDYDIHTDITKSTKQEFNNILTNLSYLDKDKTKIALVITDKNIHDIRGTLERFTTEFGFTKFLLSPRIPNGNSQIDFQNSLRMIEHLADNHTNLQINTVGPIEGCSVNGSHKCEAGLNRIVILANKTIVPCAWNNQTILGTLDDNIEDILKRGRDYFYTYNQKQRFLCKGYIENEHLY